MEWNKVGFLPLYLKLYDDSAPAARARMDGFNTRIQELIRAKGISLVASPVCRVETEFKAAAELFKANDVCAVITLHLAYSPSLESIDALADIEAPIIVLDTTQTYRFDQTTPSDEIMYNHGIHGVQDMCNLLARHDKRYFIEAGHYEKSDVIDRVAGLCRIASAAWQLRHARVGIIGTPFHAMGDFAISYPELKETLGIEVVEFDNRAAHAAVIPEQEILCEMAEDKKGFTCESFSDEDHYKSTQACLQVRKWLEDNQLTAFSANFLNVGQNAAIKCMPFLEASKCMARGIGYAGEGDVLTAALAGALSGTFPELTFTEMFCPDWMGDTVFLSHMGEINIALTAETPVLIQKEFPYTDAWNPITAYAQYKPGRAVIVNIAPLKDSKYRLILVPGKILDVPDDSNFKATVHGWFKPESGLVDCLSEYSMNGGTHHLVMVYGDVTDQLEQFGKMLGFDVQRIGG